MGVDEEYRRVARGFVRFGVPVAGVIGALSAWQIAHVVGRRVCGMAYGVPERISVNALGFVWTVVAVVLTIAAGVLLTPGRGRKRLIVGFLALALFVLGTVAIPLLAAGSCEGVGPAGRYPSGR
ncbi:hypothetical protein FK268_19400 [Tsukamurella sputi]|uniref:Uncharacterized protein n=1 Tax=Tsukamurella sputi TaxID=2591848 RepID=A0A5C5RJ41_9ACTN|nr:hypothetical protein [Tsukamurella sputi]TWS22622.1 hypothetical protein FK268_19400 [Tsukamurella sputi]